MTINKKLFHLILFLPLSNLIAAKSIEDYLNQNYKNCLEKKQRIFLTKKQKREIEQLSGSKIYSQLKVRYKNKCTQSNIYIDSHIVRTLNQTLLFEIKNSSISKIETLHFLEPKEYESPKKWVLKFKNKKLNKKLNLDADIDGLSGATLTATAVLKATRKILALDKILNEK